MNLRALFLFAGPRGKLYEEYKKGDAPDTYLVGLNHMSKYAIEAGFIENRFTEYLRKLSFNLTQLPTLSYLRSYDIVFSGSGVLTLFLVKFLLRWRKPKWAIYNTYLSNLFKRNDRRFKGWVIKKAVFSADAIISPSLAQQKFLAGIGLPTGKNYYAPYGVDYEFYAKAESEPQVSERFIFSAGRDVGRDYKTLIDAVKDLPVRLLIAALPRNLKDVGELPSNVTVSYFKPIQMPNLFKRAEFVVIPTILEKKMVGSDCSGQYVLLESMSSGKAVVTSARTTLPDYFTDGLHGLTVIPENVEDLKLAIMALWNDPDRAKAMGEAGQAVIKEKFTMEIFSRKLSEIFHEVTNR